MILHTRLASLRDPRDPRRGYVLIAVLIIIVVLSLAAYRFTDSMGAEYRAAVRTTDIARSRSAALSGVHFMAAGLADRDTFLNILNGNPTADNPALADVTVWTDPKNPQREAKFQIVSVVPVGAGVYERRNAVIDESGKLNINALIAQDKTGAVLYNALMKLPNMTEDVAANICDWVDADEEAGSAAGGGATGAENATYQSKGYRCKNGPLTTIEELLLVEGVTPQLLFGSDQNRNGLSDEANAANLDRGWSDYLTIYSREVSVDSTGQIKVWINGDDPRAIYDALKTSGIGEEMAAYIMAAKLFGQITRLDENGNVAPQKGGGKGGNTPAAVQQGTLDQLIAAVEAKLETTTSSGTAISSIMTLQGTRVTLPRSATGGGGGGKQAPTTVYTSPLNDPSRLAEVLPILLDRVSTKNAVEMIPRLNVNTAPREVIAGLPGLEDADVDAIMGVQGTLEPSDLATTTGAWLVTSANLTRRKYTTIEKYVTGSSMIYRVQAIGYVTGGGPVARFEAVIDTNLGAPRIVYCRDLSELDSPRGFAPPPKK